MQQKPTLHRESRTKYIQQNKKIKLTHNNIYDLMSCTDTIMLTF
jgi:hypothetical protein